MIPRKTLCKCKIDTKDFTLEPRPDACAGRQKRNPVFKYTVNQAFVSYWHDLNKEFPDDIMRLFSSPPNVSIPVVNITSFSFPDVLEKDWQNYELSLSTFANTVKKHELIWKDKSSKLHQELIDIKQGFTFKIPSFFEKHFQKLEDHTLNLGRNPSVFRNLLHRLLLSQLLQIENPRKICCERGKTNLLAQKFETKKQTRST